MVIHALIRDQDLIIGGTMWDLRSEVFINVNAALTSDPCPVSVFRGSLCFLGSSSKVRGTEVSRVKPYLI